MTSAKPAESAGAIGGSEEGCGCQAESAGVAVGDEEAE